MTRTAIRTEELAPQQAEALLATMGVYLSPIEDPRDEQGKRHPLVQILTMALVSVMCGADSWEEVVEFCEDERDWFESFFLMRYGVPSRSTFRRVFEMIKPESLSMCLTALVEQLRPAGRRKRRDSVIAIDGKTLRASFDRANEQSPLHLLCAFGTETGLVLGQAAVEGKSNEITALPKLLLHLDCRDRTLTADALHCHTQTAKGMKERKGEYVLALKKNQRRLWEHVRQRFAFAERMTFEKTRTGEDFGYRMHRSVDSGHGRLEQRQVDVLCAKGKWFHQAHPGWSSTQSVARVTAERTVGTGATTQTLRYFLSSHPSDKGSLIASAIRAHWMIENGLHWCLDTAFDEDRSRIRKGHGAANFAALRRFVLGLLKQDKKSTRSLKSRRKTAARKPDYRMKLLGF